MKLTNPIAACLVLLAQFAFLGNVQAKDFPAQPHISVTGEGEVEVSPDIIRLQLQVWKTGKSAADAKREVDTITAKLFASATKFGVKTEDISAGRINVNPEYEWREGKRYTVGQRVQRSVDFTIRDTSSYGDLLDELVDAEVTRIGSTQFDISDMEAQQTKAMISALENAKAKATLMAEALGTKLGAVYRIQENVNQRNTQPVMYRAAAMDSAESAPEAPMHLGTQKVNRKVEVVFYLDSQSL